MSEPPQTEQSVPESHPATTPSKTPAQDHSKTPQTVKHVLPVYSRGRRPEKTMKLPIPFTHDRESQPSPLPAQIHSCNDITDLGYVLMQCRI